MLENFFKYQSLGNDFIIFDLFKKPNFYVQQALDKIDLQNFTRKLCKRNFGIGADGVLILKTNQEHRLPEVLVFNSDGSHGQVCLNGLRCIANFLYTNYKLPQNFNIKMSNKIVACSIEGSEPFSITSRIEPANYIKEHSIKIDNKNFTGHIIDIGNPHFVITEKIDSDWLSKNGQKIETHKEFANKTNVEFIWPEDDSQEFNMLVYERGCGITLACSSGATAAIWTLFKLNKIKKEEKIKINMPGGQITGWLDNDSNILLQAQSHFVFKGEINF